MEVINFKPYYLDRVSEKIVEIFEEDKEAAQRYAEDNVSDAYREEVGQLVVEKLRAKGYILTGR